MNPMLRNIHLEFKRNRKVENGWILRWLWLGLAGVVLMLIGTVMGQANPGSTWVKDTRVSSDDILTSSQSVRIVPLSEAAALKLVRKIMQQDLNLTLAAYQPEFHLQAAETTLKTKIPDALSEVDHVVLNDKDFMFILEIKLRLHGDKTKLMLVSHPVYHVDPSKQTKPNTRVEIKVQGDASQVVSMGPIFLVPMAGSPDVGTQTLPDAADRAAKLVRAFMYYLDKRVGEKIQDHLSPK